MSARVRGFPISFLSFSTILDCAAIRGSLRSIHKDPRVPYMHIGACSSHHSFQRRYTWLHTSSNNFLLWPVASVDKCGNESGRHLDHFMLFYDLLEAIRKALRGTFKRCVLIHTLSFRVDVLGLYFDANHPGLGDFWRTNLGPSSSTPLSSGYLRQRISKLLGGTTSTLLTTFNVGLSSLEQQRLLRLSVSLESH